MPTNHEADGSVALRVSQRNIDHVQHFEAHKPMRQTDGADRITSCSDGMARSHKPLFNGLHLRLEADAAAWIEMFGGLHTLWGYYMDAARGAGFDRRTPLVRPAFKLPVVSRP